MPGPAAVLIPALVGVIAAAGFRILTALGLGFVTFNVAMPNLLNFIQSYFGQLPANILNVVGVLRLDIAITIILSAAAAKVIYRIAAAPLISFGS